MLQNNFPAMKNYIVLWCKIIIFSILSCANLLCVDFAFMMKCGDNPALFLHPECANILPLRVTQPHSYTCIHLFEKCANTHSLLRRRRRRTRSAAVIFK
jgi:hypothetical protein